MNVSYLIGNLTNNPEKVEGTNKTLCKLNIAVNANYTEADGTRPVQFFNVAVWGVLADNCLKYLKKGSKVAVVGKLQTRSWESKEGEKHYTTEIVANEVEFLSSPKEKTSEVKNATPIDDEGLPF